MKFLFARAVSALLHRSVLCTVFYLDKSVHMSELKGVQVLWNCVLLYNIICRYEQIFVFHCHYWKYLCEGIVRYHVYRNCMFNSLPHCENVPLCFTYLNFVSGFKRTKCCMKYFCHWLVTVTVS
jgi:hypothetical protein